MVKVKLNVQTMYRGELLRAGKVYEVSEETAERWIASKLAEKVEEWSWVAVQWATLNNCIISWCVFFYQIVWIFCY